MSQQASTNGVSLLDSFAAHLQEPHWSILAAVVRTEERYRETLWRELSKRLSEGSLEATGFAPGATIPTPIHPAFFNNAVPDYTADTVTSHGVSYGGVRILAAGSLGKLFAETEAASRGAGGAPLKIDDAFIREMVRFAVLDGFDTRLELVKHMKSWAGITYGDKVPSDRSIERYVERWCPAEIPLR